MQTDIAAGYKIPNISASVHGAEIILISCGFSKGRQYISKGGRELPICVGNYKNEGAKGTAKAFVGLVEEYLRSKSRLYPNLLD